MGGDALPLTLTLQGEAEELMGKVGRPVFPAALPNLGPCPPDEVLSHLAQQRHEPLHHLR